MVRFLLVVGFIGVMVWCVVGLYDNMSHVFSDYYQTLQQPIDIKCRN